MGQERPNTNRSLGSRRSTEMDGREVPLTDSDCLLEITFFVALGAEPENFHPGASLAAEGDRMRRRYLIFGLFAVATIGGSTAGVPGQSRREVSHNRQAPTVIGWWSRGGTCTSGADGVME